MQALRLDAAQHDLRVRCLGELLAEQSPTLLGMTVRQNERLYEMGQPLVPLRRVHFIVGEVRRLKEMPQFADGNKAMRSIPKSSMEAVNVNHHGKTLVLINRKTGYLTSLTATAYSLVCILIRSVSRTKKPSRLATEHRCHASDKPIGPPMLVMISL